MSLPPGSNMSLGSLLENFRGAPGVIGGRMKKSGRPSATCKDWLQLKPNPIPPNLYFCESTFVSVTYW